MKKLVGGDYLLDLTPIEIEQSEDGATKTNITNKDVIAQLTNLKNYIRNPEMIKPVWVLFNNGETDEKIVARGQLSVVDTGEFEICVSVNGYKLQLFIEFTQAELSDHTPIDDWYIDTNDAKYLFTSDVQNIDAITSSGDLSSVKADEIIENMTGYSFSKLSETTNLTREFIYAGVVKNGNKVTFVIACNLTRSDDIPTNAAAKLGMFTIPSELFEKLYQAQIGQYEYLSVDESSAWSSDSNDKKLQIYSYKSGAPQTDILFEMNPAPINELSVNTKYFFRYEITLLISENLIPQP